jgi:hypothetical protein
MLAVRTALPSQARLWSDEDPCAGREYARIETMARRRPQCTPSPLGGKQPWRRR